MQADMHANTLVRAAACLALALCALPQPAAADPSLRKQVDQRGDFALIGNTLAHECGALTPPVPAPVVGTIGNCPELNFTAPDVYFRADDPTAGAVRADSNIAATDARSTAVLNLPMQANVTYARLYWGSYAASMTPGGTARLERPSSGVNMSLTADQIWTVPESGNTGRYWYQATADVTEIVRAQASGPYRVGEVSSIPLDMLAGDPYGYVAWYMVVFYELATEPQRNLALFEGLELVEPGRPTDVRLAGFLVPSSGYDAKLGIVTFEGDATIEGDGVTFEGTTLSDALNPAMNFFNSTRSALGKPVSVMGDLPQLTGEPRSMSGIDIDVLDLTSLVKPGQTSANLESNTTLDTYLFAAFVTSVSTLKPNFQSSQKTVKTMDPMGGQRAKPGEQLEYTIEVSNNGSDDSLDSQLRDALPKGTTLVPGSLEIVSGPGMGKKTDAAGDDEAELDMASSTAVFRIGTGATSSTGGSLAVGDKVQVRFKVQLAADARGTISNQGTVHASGKKGAAAEDTPTDGDPTKPGAQTTDVSVNVCDVDADCKPPTPLCDISSDPQGCVECVTSADCNEPAKPDCLTQSHTCGCALGAGHCEKDTDKDGISDDGENTVGTDPNDWDTDDDGTPDGSEFAPEIDSDGDGLPNAHDADSDNDGLFDGTEQGFDCDNPQTKRELGRCRPDADKGVGKTNPVKPDTDRGGVRDASEDFNLNGRVDASETDPVFGKGTDDKPHDTDGDGVSDELELFLHSDPNDGDTDDDGLPDGAEANPSEDTDADRLLNISDVDSDNDALFDGTELGRDCSAKGTAFDKMHCIADADSGSTKTSPLLLDTDRGGARDGSEDANLNGRVDTDERDPTAMHGTDDGMVVDSDGDGLSDGAEKTLGSNPADKDSDDDGVPDGAEPNPSDDQDGDTKRNIVDPDSDGDGLFDGTELGFSCRDPAIDVSKMQCLADADEGMTLTGSLSPDTDRGGVIDGVEDVNHDGKVGLAELDPNDPADDVIGKPCAMDANCGKMDSGLVCDVGRCAFGCRGMGGNTCPTGLFCSSRTMDVGMCSDMMPPVPDAGMPVIPPPIDAGPMLAPGGKLGGAGCNCRVSSGSSQPSAASAWLLLALSALWLQRRRSR